MYGHQHSAVSTQHVSCHSGVRDENKNNLNPLCVMLEAMMNG
jgi:hypothetical protein